MVSSYYKNKKFLPLLLFLLLTPLLLILPSSKPSQKTEEILDKIKPNITISQNPKPENIDGECYLLLVADTNQILLEKNPDLKIYPASTTKLVTALTALNIYPKDEIITVENAYSEGKNMSLSPGEQLTVDSLVKALIVYSANDAAYVLGNHHPKGMAGFIDSMNNLVGRYSLTHTHLMNADGVDNQNHYSSCYDLSQIARLAIKYPPIVNAAQSSEITVTDISGKIIHKLETTNELLGKLPEISGLKTGWTPQALGSFIGLINYRNLQFISVVATSHDRFGDTSKLIDWLKKSY